MFTPLFTLVRTIVVTLTAAVATATLGPTVMLARLFRVPQGPNSVYTRCIRAWARSINRAAGVTIRVHGAEHLRNDNGAVYISNHVSWFDIFPLAATVPWCSFVAKTEIRRIPVFGFAAEAVGIVFLDRDNRKQAFKSYEKAATVVREGRGIVVCPEGTRGRDYHLRPFKKGPFVLAIASQSPIIPTVVHGAREVMPKGSFWIKPGVVDLHFLPPVPTEGFDYDHRAELMTVVWEQMAAQLREAYGVTTSEHAVANQV
jgi:1-acyl-sn-glycerol-3-phosphate acyltransferase